MNDSGLPLIYITIWTFGFDVNGCVFCKRVVSCSHTCSLYSWSHSKTTVTIILYYNSYIYGVVLEDRKMDLMVLLILAYYFYWCCKVKFRSHQCLHMIIMKSNFISSPWNEWNLNMSIIYMYLSKVTNEVHSYASFAPSFI